MCCFIIAFTVLPQSIEITTKQGTLREGQMIDVLCKVDQVKPLKDLTIQLLNATAPLPGKQPEYHIKADGITKSVEREFSVLFSR